jgi:hypothetical protein
MTEEEMRSTFAGNGTKALSIIGTILGGLGVLGDGALLGGAANSNYISKEAFDLSLQLSDSKRDNALLSAELNTEKKMVEVYNALNTKINDAISNQTAINSAQAVTNSAVTSTLAVAQNNIAQLMALTKVVIPNSSTCPGWGNVTITPTTTTTTTSG